MLARDGNKLTDHVWTLAEWTSDRLFNVDGVQAHLRWDRQRIQDATGVEMNSEKGDSPDPGPLPESAERRGVARTRRVRTSCRTKASKS